MSVPLLPPEAAQPPPEDLRSQRSKTNDAEDFTLCHSASGKA
jgi:hypothetical protein